MVSSCLLSNHFHFALLEKIDVFVSVFWIEKSQKSFYFLLFCVPHICNYLISIKPPIKCSPKYLITFCSDYFQHSRLCYSCLIALLTT